MSTSTSTPVNTAKITGRRPLKFNSLPDILADADALTGSGYRQLGNWSLGQMCQHLATAMSFAVEDAAINPPWVVRFVAAKVFKKRILRGPMQAGFKLDSKSAKVMVPDRTADPDGIAALRTMMARWQSEPLTYKHPFFGYMTPEEWKTLTLRHSEMHLSFLLPKAACCPQ